MKILYKTYAILFGRPLFFPLHRFMHSLALRGMGVMNYYDLDVSGEAFLMKALKERIKQPKVVIDIGANEGKYSELVLEHLNPHKIFAVEAHPVTAQRLRDKVVASGQNIEVLHYAVTAVAIPSITLYDNTACGSSHASTLKNVVPHTAEATATEVPAITLDALAERHDIEHVDLLKIDIEGAELSALKGAQSLLSRAGVDYIQFEFNEMNLGSGCKLRDFIELLDGYQLFRVLPRGLLKIDPYHPRIHEIFAFQNILAIRKP